MKAGDIYFVSLEPTIGREQRGFRPVLILTPESFHRLTGTAIIAAITSGGEFARRNGFTVVLPAGLKTHGVVRFDQIRTLDLTARSARYIEPVPHQIIDEVLARVIALLEVP